MFRESLSLNAAIQEDERSMQQQGVKSSQRVILQPNQANRQSWQVHHQTTLDNQVWKHIPAAKFLTKYVPVFCFYIQNKIRRF
jgi:hypothetical protein